jgi:hypothetical protein
MTGRQLAEVNGWKAALFAIWKLFTNHFITKNSRCFSRFLAFKTGIFPVAGVENLGNL